MSIILFFVNKYGGTALCHPDEHFFSNLVVKHICVKSIFSSLDLSSNIRHMLIFGHMGKLTRHSVVYIVYQWNQNVLWGKESCNHTETHTLSAHCLF